MDCLIDFLDLGSIVLSLGRSWATSTTETTGHTSGHATRHTTGTARETLEDGGNNGLQCLLLLLEFFLLGVLVAVQPGGGCLDGILYLLLVTFRDLGSQLLVIEGRTHLESIVLQRILGINTGTVVGGTVGAGDRLSYTLLGDAVNTAARLEELNKVHGTGILISGATLLAAGDTSPARRIGEVPIRGRSESLEIYTVDEA